MSDFKKKAEKWAEDYLKSEEGKLNIERQNDELLEFMTFGRLFYIKDQEGTFMRATREIMSDVGEGNTISTSEIVERYKQLLGEEGFKKLVDND